MPERREQLFFGFYTALVEFYTKEVLQGFLPHGFPEENICVLVFLCFCAFFSFSDLLVTNCFKISSKKFKKIQHGIIAIRQGFEITRIALGRRLLDIRLNAPREFCGMD